LLNGTIIPNLLLRGIPFSPCTPEQCAHWDDDDKNADIHATLKRPEILNELILQHEYRMAIFVT
jgi:hypothetical protein